MHARQHIRDTVAATVTGLATTADRVKVSRLYALQPPTLPELLIYTTTEVVERVITIGQPRRINRQLELIIEGRAQGAGMQDTLDTIAEEVEAAMSVDPSLGINAVDTQLQQTDYQLDGDGKTAQGSVMLRYRIDYVTAENNPSILI